MRRLAGLMIVFFFASISTPFLVGAEGRFAQYDFTLKGEITDVIMEDLNGDGLLEALAIHIDPNQDPPGRYLTIIPQTKTSGFDATKKIEWQFPPEVATFDVGDVSADPGKELICMTEQGVSYASVASGAVGPLKPLLTAPSVVAIAYNRGVPYYNFVRDYTGDGKDDVLVVGFTQATFAKQTDGYAWTQSKLNLRPEIDIQAFDIGRILGDSEHPMYRVSYYVPQAYSNDANADGLIDLLINSRRKVLVFNQGPDGFSGDPSQTHKMEIVKESEEQRGGRHNPPTLVFQDLDGDGKVDVLATQAKGNFPKLESRTLLFWGKDGSLAKNQPSQEFQLDGTTMAIFIHDVNNDGRLDLIMPTMDFRFWGATTAIVTGGIKVLWNFFLQTPDRSFNVKPDRSFTTELKFSLTKFQLEGAVPNVFGDFNGDHYPDQAVGQDKAVLLVSLRDQNGELMGIDEKVTLPVSIFNRAIDVNNDGLSDIVVHYEDTSDYVNQMHILVNKGNWTK